MDHDSSSRIASVLRSWISAAPGGARLPSTRELVATHSVSPVTVQRALRTLTAQGLIETRPGVGTFVRTAAVARPLDYGWQTAALGSPPHRIPSASTTLRAAPNGSVALHAGYPDRQLLPERLVRAALTRAARSDASIARASVAGLPELQSWFARELALSSPAGVSAPTPSDVIVLPGSQSGLASAFRALVTAGQPLLMESPTYWGAIVAAAQTGVRVIPIPSGSTGPEPDVLRRAFAETGARAFYAQPNFANPTGAQWSSATAREVLDVVMENDAFLIEDDWAHDFGITTTSTPVAALDDSGHVVYLRSLTKSVSPSIRIAAIIARGPARERILADRGGESLYVSGTLQAAALDVVTHPAWHGHLRGLRQQLRARRDLLVDSVVDHAPSAHLAFVPAGGLNLWLQLPDAADLPSIARRCEDAGVLISSGNDWFPAEPTSPFIRLNYAGANPGAFPDAVRTIERVLRA